jgi:hypothetical protein
MALCGERMRMKWRTDSAAGGTANAIIGTRGTENGEFDTDNYTFSPTLELHGAINQWVGNLVMSDNSTQTLVSFFPNAILYFLNDANDEAPRKDNIFDSEYNDFPLLGNAEASADQWMILNGENGVGRRTAGELFYDPLTNS